MIPAATSSCTPLAVTFVRRQAEADHSDGIDLKTGIEASVISESARFSNSTPGMSAQVRRSRRPMHALHGN